MEKENDIDDSIIVRYLEGTIGAEEMAQLEQWLSESESHKKLFFELKHIDELHQADELPVNFVSESWRRLESKILMPRRTMRLNFLKYAAVAVVAIAVTLGVQRLFQKEPVIQSTIINTEEGAKISSMWKTGAHPDTDNQWRYDEVVNGKKNYVADGVYVVSGSATYDSYGRITSDNRVFAKNETPVSYETYIKSYFRKGADVNYLSETFIKLRELSLTYDIPNSLSKKIGISNSSIALVGQNLLLWTKEYKFADPDKASDDLNSPSVRYIGVNFKLEF